MKTQSLCVFPDTRPKDEILFPLVQFFADVVYIAPTENDLSAPNALPPLAAELLRQGVLRFHCPTPLGVDQERFFRLIQEIQQRPADYTHLALAGIGHREMENKNAIISAVRRQNSKISETEAEEKQIATLWQARLILKLNEIVERQEEEIQQSLRRITFQENGLLQTLRDDHADLLPLPDISTDSHRTRLRLKAWRNLLLSNSQSLPADIFVTDSRDAFDVLIETNAAETQPVCILPLPAIGADCDFVQQQATFQQATADLRSDWPTAFQRKMWEKRLEQHYPTQKHGRCHLSLHTFSCTAINGLIGILE